MLTLNLVMSFLFSTIDAVIFVSLLAVFRRSKDDYKFTDIIIVASIVMVSSSLTLLGIVPYFKVFIIAIVLFLVTFLYKIELYERLLLVVLYYFIIIISELLVLLTISSILNINLKEIESSYKYSFLFLGTISKSLTITISSIVKRIFNKKRIILPNFLNYALISVLIFSTIAMVLLFYITLNSASENIQFILFLICLFMLLISVGVFTIYFSANSFYINLQKETTKSIYNKSYEKFIIDAKKREESLSKIWHDMNNHIQVLESMTYSENNKSIRYLSSLKEKFKVIPNKIKSGNSLIDTILNYKYSEAIYHNITFDAKAISPPQLGIDDLDLSSILFNTIDNSIEACLNSNLEKKSIYLDLYPEGNFLYYKIKNSYNSNIKKSVKKISLNKKEHISEGYGLKIIEDIVAKYDGFINIDKDNNNYDLTIVLHLNATD